MRPLWFSEVEPFPCSVLARRWPSVPNLGDMLRLPGLIRLGLVPAPDVFIAGTPCQAFSFAGRRGGLADERGALTLTYVEVLDEIDKKRPGREAVGVWENVPGVLSSKDNAFGCFIGGLAGSGCALEPGPRPEPCKSRPYWFWDKSRSEHRPRWGNAGYIVGPKRTVAWRVLDAQYFGVPQRRRRVFVVASARSGFNPGAVLFEREGLRRDTPPSREEGEAVAGTVTESSRKDDRGTPAGNLIPCWWDGGQISQTLDAVLHKGQTMPEKNRFPAILQPDPIAFNCKDNGRDAAQGVAPTLRAMGSNSKRPNGGGQLAVVAFAENSRAEIRLEGGEGRRTGCIPAHCGGKPGQGAPSIIDADLTVRRLMPVERERLQGIPDNHTAVLHKGKPAKDSPRYKSIGNSKAVPVIQWLGRRLLREIVQ